MAGIRLSRPKANTAASSKASPRSITRQVERTNWSAASGTPARASARGTSLVASRESRNRCERRPVGARLVHGGQVHLEVAEHVVVELVALLAQHDLVDEAAAQRVAPR